MTDLAKVREDYRAGKTALFESLAASGASMITRMRPSIRTFIKVR